MYVLFALHSYDTVHDSIVTSRLQSKTTLSLHLCPPTSQSEEELKVFYYLFINGGISFVTLERRHFYIEWDWECADVLKKASSKVIRT